MPARSTPLFVRPITSTPPNPDDRSAATNLFSRSRQFGAAGPRREKKNPGSNAMARLSEGLGFDGAQETTIEALSRDLRRHMTTPPEEEPYHFHILAHKQNTHVTVTKPNRDAIISLSCGDIGFRKARRKQYDAAYQLTVYVLERLYDAGWDTKIERLEVVLRGFGTGREAATKVLLGTEGARLKDKIVRVSDATRIKFGGTKSKNPRRI